MKGGDCLAMVVGSIQQRRVYLVRKGLRMCERVPGFLSQGDEGLLPGVRTCRHKSLLGECGTKMGCQLHLRP